jgi:hypothetical protein
MAKHFLDAIPDHTGHNAHTTGGAAHTIRTTGGSPKIPGLKSAARWGRAR